MNIVVSDPKSRKALNLKTDKELFVGKKIGENIDLSAIGLQGYNGRITGGSDKQGFPMKPTLSGQQRRKVLLEKGVGLRSNTKGMKKRKTVAGNTVTANTAQLNVAVLQQGEKRFEELVAALAKPAEKKQESIKEKAVKESLEKAGSAELAFEKTKPKARG